MFYSLILACNSQRAAPTWTFWGGRAAVEDGGRPARGSVRASLLLAAAQQRFCGKWRHQSQYKRLLQEVFNVSSESILFVGNVQRGIYFLPQAQVQVLNKSRLTLNWANFKINTTFNVYNFLMLITISKHLLSPLKVNECLRDAQTTGSRPLLQGVTR